MILSELGIKDGRLLTKDSLTVDGGPGSGQKGHKTIGSVFAKHQLNIAKKL